MDKIEKLQQLLELKNSGAITQSEFDELAKRVREETTSSTADTKSPAGVASQPQTWAEPTALHQDLSAPDGNGSPSLSDSRRRVVGAVAATGVVVIGGFLAFARGGDPIESEEYQSLLERKGEIQQSIHDTQAKLDALRSKVQSARSAHESEMAKLGSDLDEWQSRAARTAKALGEVRELD